MQKNPQTPKAKSSTSPQKSKPVKLEKIKDAQTPESPAKAGSTKNLGEIRTPKIPRNVNSYRHVINSSENEIEWMLKLRSHTDSGHRLEHTSTQPFNFDGKSTESLQNRKVAADLDGRNRLHEAGHLFMHRLGHTPAQGSVAFETGLRNYGLSSEKVISMERGWRNTPKKDRQEYPVLYPSYNETVHIKNWSTKNLSIKTHTAFEGYLTLPTYVEHYGRQTKNVSDIKHLLKSPGQNMSTADWEISMRHYGDRSKPKEFTEHEDLKKTFKEIKKVERSSKRV